VRSAENIEKLVKNLDLGIDTNAQTDQAVLGELLDAQNKSMKRQSAFILPNIRKIIMKNPMTKFAVAAVIIIAVLIGVNPFGNSNTNVLWADVIERFESVPFFHLTIYAGHDKSLPGNRLEIWKSENGRVRAHEDNKVIFADVSDGNHKIIGYDRLTLEPVNTTGLTHYLLKDLSLDGQFSLDTLLDSMPPGAKELTPVETAQTVATRDIVVFEAICSQAGEGVLIWALRESKLPILMRFSDPRNNEYGDFLFDYSEQKDAAFFDPDAFINETREQSIQSHSENGFNEQEVIDAFRGWTILSGGAFPSSLGLKAVKDIDPNIDFSSLYNGSNTQNGALHFETPYATLDRDNPPPQEEINKYFNNVMFVLMGRVQQVLAETSDWHYAGKGVKLGNADKAVLWYCLKGFETYRVIYGDLSAKDVKPANLPK
jgi:hypothetical protein